MSGPTIDPEKILARAPAEDAATLQQLNEIASEIIQRLDAERQDKRAPYDRSDVNYASEIGHPCKKHLVHARRDWDKKTPIDINGMYRIAEGIQAEWQIKKDLGDVGFQLSESQRSFSIPELKIRGRIDGLLPINREVKNSPRLPGVPAEIKTIGPNYWESTKTIEDLKQHRAWWIRGYPSQLNAYLYSSGSPFGFFILKTFGKRPRILPMLLDYSLADADFKKIEDVNHHVGAGTYPEPIPFDAQICGLCSFAHLCQPLRATEFREIPMNEIPELEDYLLLRTWNERYEEAKKKLIGTSDKPGRYHGINAIILDIAISTTIQQRTQYDVPKEVKGPYARKQEVVITKIERVGG